MQWDWEDLNRAKTCPVCVTVFAVQYDEVEGDDGDWYEYAYPREPEDGDVVGGVWEREP
jgi:hypothetical protein